EEAARLGERIRAAVAEHSFALDDGTVLTCTLSIGVAVYPDDATDVTALIKQADLAMYRAKQTRNAVASARELVAPAQGVRPAEPELPAHELEVNRSAGLRGLAGSAVVWATVLAGVVCTAWSMLGVIHSGISPLLIPLLALALGSEFLQVRVYTAKKEK